MSRLSFRPRPLDIHKKLPIVKSVKDFEDDDVPTTANAATTASSTRNSHLLRLSSDAAEPEVFFFVVSSLGHFVEQLVCVMNFFGDPGEFWGFFVMGFWFYG